MKSKNLDKYYGVQEFERITFGELIENLGCLYENKIAIKDQQGCATYAELDKDSNRVRQKLVKLGIHSGDIVILQCKNTIYFIKILFALFKLGAVPVLVLPAYREQEILKIVEKTKATAYIAPNEYLGFQYINIVNALKRSVKDIFCLLINDTFVDCEKEESISIDLRNPVEYDDVAVLLMSGGTTGEPKLIPRTHADYIYNAKMAAKRSRLNQDSVYLAALPIAHNMPLACPGILGTLCAGGTVILSYYSSPDEIMDLIEQERVTITGLVPTLAQLCLELLQIDSFDVSSLEVIISGGARLDTKLAEDIINNFHCVLQNQFGTAEGLILSTALDDPVEWTMRYQGKPISEADKVRIINEMGNDVSDGEDGELIVMGPYTIEGYYNEQKNREKFTENGFYRTGDRARFEEGGNIRILGRMVEQINRAGEKIQPSEIEEALIGISGIQSVIVVAIEDSLLGQRSCAFIQLISGYHLDEKKIYSEIQKKGIVRYKIPDQIEFVDEWPVTKMGKIDINKLKKKVTGK